MLVRPLSALALLIVAACDRAERPEPQPAPLPAEVVQSGDAYFSAAQSALRERLALAPNTGPATNVILFVADGMDPTTVIAARILAGQQAGMLGEENYLSFERFPYVAYSKTYTHDYQVPDSAGTMSAMITGVKTNSGVLSVTKDVQRNDCEGAKANPAETLGELADRAGLAVGVVSTARITHATPAAVFTHSANRNWEDDMSLPAGVDCRDIARQFIEYGGEIDVVLGGGRRHFYPNDFPDPEDEGETGTRGDGRDLVAEWVSKSDAHQFVWDKVGFDRLDPASDPKVLGLFERSHMEYEIDRASDTAGEPSLAEMTAKAIEILQNDPDGFFLVVEAGRVDHAHHGGNAARALTDAIAFADAVAVARDMTSPDDTLVIATADHGHTMAFQGYPARGNKMLDIARSPIGDPIMARDGKAYTTLVYGNGPGAVPGDAPRPDPAADDVFAADYRQQAAIPSYSETHGGQDVGIYADGPGAYLFTGVVEQNYIYHVVDHALRLEQKLARAE
ncbi:MAG: alkaline phosphatase [Pseudomonadota bacterium]